MPLEKIFLRGINPTLPTVYDDGLSYMEAVAKLQSKINECIDLIQKADVEGVQKALKEALEYVNKSVQNVDSKLAEQLTEVDIRISELLTAVERDIAETNRANELLIENAIIELERFIAQMSLTVQATNPLNGRQETLNKSLGVTDSICRNFALTAEHYDVLNIPASVYDSYGIKAFDYDVYGCNFTLSRTYNHSIRLYDSLCIDNGNFKGYILPYGYSCSWRCRIRPVTEVSKAGYGDYYILFYFNYLHHKLDNVIEENTSYCCGTLYCDGNAYPIYYTFKPTNTNTYFAVDGSVGELISDKECTIRINLFANHFNF